MEIAVGRCSCRRGGLVQADIRRLSSLLIVDFIDFDRANTAEKRRCLAFGPMLTFAAEGNLLFYI